MTATDHASTVTSRPVVYGDVVDVPILEAWEAFVIRPNRRTSSRRSSSSRRGSDNDYYQEDENDYDSDSLFLGAEDVYSHYNPASRSHSLRSSLSIGTMSTGDD